MFNYCILIPYRNRETHLEYFINHTVPILPKHFQVCVIEQGDELLFNRGKLLNIGFQENKNNFDIFITHDVDLNPTKNTFENFYDIEIEPNLFWGIYTSCWNTLGGIISFQKETFERINGFPNNFFGWGTEDKALQNRAELYQVKIQKNILNNDPKRFDYFKIFDDVQDRVKTPDYWNKEKMEVFVFPQLSEQQKKEYVRRQGGINSLQYKLIHKEVLIEDKIFKLKVTL
jgi:hypothetical protein